MEGDAVFLNFLTDEDCMNILCQLIIDGMLFTVVEANTGNFRIRFPDIQPFDKVKFSEVRVKTVFNKHINPNYNRVNWGAFLKDLSYRCQNIDMGRPEMWPDAQQKLWAQVQKYIKNGYVPVE